MNNFNTMQSIGEIVSILPKASEVFRKYNIDFCCGGNRPLSAAIKEQGLNESEIMQKLEEAYYQTKELVKKVDFRDMKSTELIEYIVNTHHAYLRRSLPETGDLVAKVLRAHGANHQELFNVHKLFNALKTELEQHLIKEEELLFPLIRKYDSNPSDELRGQISKVLKETEDEHEGAGNILKEMRRITAEYIVPDDGCRTYKLAYSMIQEIEGDLFEHIHLENNILFKRFDLSVN